MAPESTPSSNNQKSQSPHPHWQKIVLQGLAGLTLLGAIADVLPRLLNNADFHLNR